MTDPMLTVGHIHQGVQRLKKKTIHTAAGLGKQDTPYGANMGETAILSHNHRFEQDLAQGCALLRVSRKDTVNYLRLRLAQADDTNPRADQRSFARDLAVATAASAIGLVGRFVPLESLLSGPRGQRLTTLMDGHLPAMPAASLNREVNAWADWLDPKNRQN